MSTKKTTTTTKKQSKRTALWNEYFKSALQGLCATTKFGTDTEVGASDQTTYVAARLVRLAEKTADIATARNS